MLSVIVPFVREWPQVVFTIRSIAEEFWDEDFEVIAVDNLQPKMQEDRATPQLKELVKLWDKERPWLKYYHYQDTLSHWQCKNFAMSKAKGDIYWFVDAHCIIPKNSASDMYNFYRRYWQTLKGSIHLPLTYQILEPRQLIYKMVVNYELHDYHYSFLTYKNNGKCAKEVPAMSTCGMMIHKEIMDATGRWPTSLGIYGGGENFMNYVLAIMGYKKWIFNGKSLYHHGDKRGYSWNYYDYQKNRAIATYMFGGEELMTNWVMGNKRLVQRERIGVIREVKKLKDQREHIKAQQQISIDEFASQWKDTEYLKVA